METIDIRWVDLILGISLVLIPLGILAYYRTSLLKPAVIAVARMVVQLLLVGFYLELMFEVDSAWLNVLWLVIMIIIANFSITGRGELARKYFMIPLFASLLISVVFVDAFFLGVALRLDHVFEARFMIPVTGMIMGNSLRSNIIGLHSFYHNLHRDRAKYRYFLVVGAKRSEALFPFMQQALKEAFNPVIATMAVMGLIALPGTMTGQIISGSDPGTAIKYQILFMVCIFVASMSSVVLTVFFANRLTFDDFHRIRKGVIKQ